MVEDRVKTEENLGTMLVYLMDGINRLKVRLDDHPSTKIAVFYDSSPVKSLTEEDLDEDNMSVSSRLGDLTPSDQGRWKSPKAAEQARSNFIQILKDLDIASIEDNWSKWDSFILRCL